MNTLLCRNCNAPLEASAVRETIYTSACHHCHFIYPVSTFGQKDEALLKLPKPDTVYEFQLGDTLHITENLITLLQKYGPGYFIFLVMVLSSSHDPDFIGMLAALPVFGMTYYGFYRFTHRWAISIDKNGEFRDVMKSIRAKKGRIEKGDQLYCKEERTPHAVKYVLSVMQPSGKDTPLYAMPRCLEMLYIEQRIERFLGLEDKIIYGELKHNTPGVAYQLQVARPEDKHDSKPQPEPTLSEAAEPPKGPTETPAASSTAPPVTSCHGCGSQMSLQNQQGLIPFMECGHCGNMSLPQGEQVMIPSPPGVHWREGQMQSVCWGKPLLIPKVNIKPEAWVVGGIPLLGIMFILLVTGNGLIPGVFIGTALLGAFGKCLHWHFAKTHTVRFNQSTWSIEYGRQSLGSTSLEGMTALFCRHEFAPQTGQQAYGIYGLFESQEEKRLAGPFAGPVLPLYIVQRFQLMKEAERQKRPESLNRSA